MKRASMTLLAAGLSVAASAVNLIDNGGFETPYFGTGFYQRNPGETMGAWVVSGWIDHTGYDWWLAASGHQSVDLNGPSAGSIYQDISTSPGTVYRLSFALSGNPYGYQDKTMIVRWGAYAVEHVLFPAGNTPLEMGWVTKSYFVTAHDPITRLSFTSTTGAMDGALGYTTYYGPAIDDVKVEPMNMVAPEEIYLGPGWALSGELGELIASDDARLVLRPGLVFSLANDPIRLRLAARLPTPTVGAMLLFVEANSSNSAVRQSICLWDNWADDFVELDADRLGPGDRLKTLDLPFPDRFIDTANGNLVVLELRYRATNVLFAYPWLVRIDQVAWGYLP